MADDRTWLIGLMASGKSTVGALVAPAIAAALDGATGAAALDGATGGAGPDGATGGARPAGAGSRPVEYVDNDATIAVLAGRTTVELAREGGEVLHQWESRYVHDLVVRVPPVLAGIPASIADRPDDLALLARTGLLVYLRADLDTLVARVEAGPPRPWLEGDVRSVLAAMFDTRDPLLWAGAGVVVDATRPPAEVAAAVLEARREALAH